MRQSDLDRAVARATGESVNLIQARGFSLLAPPRAVIPFPRHLRLARLGLRSKQPRRLSAALA